MLSRRDLMISAGAATLATACEPKAAADGGAELTKLLDAFFEELLDASPQFATQAGLDKDARAAASPNWTGPRWRTWRRTRR